MSLIMRVSNLCKLVLGTCSLPFLQVTMEEMEAFKRKYPDKMTSRSEVAPSDQCRLWTGVAKGGSLEGWNVFGSESCRHFLFTVSFSFVITVFISMTSVFMAWTLATAAITLSVPTHITFPMCHIIRGPCVTAGVCTSHLGIHPACLLHLTL